MEIINRVEKDVGGITKKSITIKKVNNTPIKINEVINIYNNWNEKLENKHPDKTIKTMIRAVGIGGNITLKGYSEDIDNILSEEDYWGGKVRDERKFVSYTNLTFSYYMQ